MKAKISDALTAAVFVLFTFGILFVTLITPDKAFSEYERRKLAAFPQITSQSVFSTNWMSNFEKYTLDQFPKRQEFRSVKAVTEFYAFRKSDMSDLYIKNGVISKYEYPLSESGIVSAGEKLSSVADAYFLNNKVYYSVIPDKNYFMADDEKRLDYEKLLSLFGDNMRGEYIDIFDTLTLDDYYASDTHFRIEKVQDSASALLNGMNVPFVNPVYTTEILTDSFRGVYAGQIAISGKGENLYAVHNQTVDGATAENAENGKVGSVYDLSALDTFDPYNAFLYGSAAIVTVTSQNPQTGRELILFRDSFGSSIAPLMLCGYDKITLVDTRYISPSLIGDYISYNENTDVLFLYSTLLINSSGSLRGM